MMLMATTKWWWKRALYPGGQVGLKVTGAGYEDASLRWRSSNEHLLRWGASEDGEHHKVLKWRLYNDPFLLQGSITSKRLYSLDLLWRWCLLDNDVSDGVAMMAMVAIMGLVLAIMVSSMVRPPPKSATNIIPAWGGFHHLTAAAENGPDFLFLWWPHFFCKIKL